jgi:DNA repair protein RadC
METTRDAVAHTITEITVTFNPNVPNSHKPIITKSQQVYELFLAQWNPNTIELYEEFKVMYLNRANRLLGICDLSKGGMTNTVADPRIILGIAVKVLATVIILAHNHPGGTLRPSAADEAITKKIIEAARVHEIAVHDHIIISPDGYFSFADEGLLL